MRPMHAGVLVPWANTVVEAELHRVTGADVTWHYSRLVPESRTTGLDGRFLSGLLEAAPAALAQLAALPLQAAYLACTSAAFVYPELTEAARCGATVTLVSAFDAIVAVLRELPASRVVLLTPYPEDVTDLRGRDARHGRPHRHRPGGSRSSTTDTTRLRGNRWKI